MRPVKDLLWQFYIFESHKTAYFYAASLTEAAKKGAKLYYKLATTNEAKISFWQRLKNYFFGQR
jgi:hypothetical protein